jgi:hypothetical protein
MPFLLSRMSSGLLSKCEKHWPGDSVSSAIRFRFSAYQRLTPGIQGLCRSDAPQPLPTADRFLAHHAACATYLDLADRAYAAAVTAP